MMGYLILSGLAILVVLFGYGRYQLYQAKRNLEQVKAQKQALEAKARQQAVEIQQKNAEVNYAKTARKNENRARRSSELSVNQQLQQHGWFRDEADNHGVQCVRADLSRSGGYSSDQTADSCSQSDL